MSYIYNEVKLKLLVLRVFRPCTLERHLSINPVLTNIVFAIIRPQKVTTTKKKVTKKTHHSKTLDRFQISEIYFLLLFHKEVSTVFFSLGFFQLLNFLLFSMLTLLSYVSSFLWYTTYRNFSGISRIYENLLLFLVYSYLLL